jgi:glycosyltransferase involved in cell wall biosynthesis
MSSIPVRLGVQQRVLPAYRVPFMDVLAEACSRGMSLFAGDPRPVEMIEVGVKPQRAEFVHGNNLHLFAGGAYLYFQRGLMHWLEEWQPEVLVLEANPRNLTVPAAVSWMHRRARPVIGWGLGAPGARGPFFGLRSAARNRFLHNFDALITYSAQGMLEYQKANFPLQRIFLAPNAVAPRPKNSLPARSAQFQQRPVALFVGRLQARKRLDVLLRACAQLPAVLRPELWVVGDGSIRQELETLAANLYPQTRFFGARHGSELEPLFCAADLFVLPGTGGLAVQQAMSFGLPVVVGEADGTQGDLVRPENGWLAPTGDVQALAQILSEAFSDPVRLRQMGAASYRLVAEEMNLERMVAAFEEAIRAVSGGEYAHSARG